MFTILELNKQRMDKQYKLYFNKYKEVLKNATEDSWWINVGDSLKYDIRNSITYIISCLRSPDIGTLVEARLGQDEIEHIKKTITEKNSSKKYKNKNESNKCEYISCLSDNGYYIPAKLMVGCIEHTQNPIYRAEYVSEAITLAKNYLTLEDELYINPFAIHCLLLNYWCGAKNEDIEAYISKYIANKSTLELAKNYINNISTKPMDVSFIELIDRFIESTLEQAKNNKRIEGMLEISIKNIYSSTCTLPKEYIEALGVQRKRAFGAAVLLQSTLWCKWFNCWEFDVLILYSKKLSIDNKDKMDKNRIAVFNIMFSLTDYGINNRNLFEMYKLLIVNMDKVYKKYTLSKSGKELADKSIKELESKLAEFKKRTKELSSKLKDCEVELRKNSNTIRDLEKKSNSGISLDDFNSLHTTITELQNRIMLLNNKETDLHRIINKKDKECIAVQERLGKVENDYAELYIKYEREKELNNVMCIHRAFNEIDMSCFVNAIKGYKLMMIGGDMMHTKLREYGLNNIRLLKAGCKELTYEDIANIDLIIVATAFVDHSSTEIASKACKIHKIPVLNFNNKNADILIYSIFSEIFK